MVFSQFHEGEKLINSVIFTQQQKCNLETINFSRHPRLLHLQNKNDIGIYRRKRNIYFSYHLVVDKTIQKLPLLPNVTFAQDKSFPFNRCSSFQVFITSSSIVQVFQYSLFIQALFALSSIHYLLKHSSRFRVFITYSSLVHVFEDSLPTQAFFTFSTIHYLYKHCSSF